ncbi:MAG: glutamate-5-semialdehyde dehydrogenase [Alphaproteobacteria bacterium]
METKPDKTIETLGRAAKNAAKILAGVPDDTVSAVLSTLAVKLRENKSVILAANAKDIESAKAKNLSDAMLDRLALNDARIESMAGGVETVRALPSPVGKVLWETRRPNGLHIQRIAVPIGVFGMIYESRPNVTIDAAILCLKSRNAVILRGGSESLQSSLTLHVFIEQSLEQHGLPASCVGIVSTADREIVGAMLRASQYIDIMIPRGGKSLIERVMNEARMPVFGHLDGNCHIYVHPSANPAMAVDIIVNAKLRRTGICGALESLLLDKNIDTKTAKNTLTTLLDKGCEIVGDADTQKLEARIIPATEEDWSTEYLSAKLSCKFVDGVEQAVDHINTYGSHHTESILAGNPAAVGYFLKNIDSAVVMHNASTQFTDGGEFGMGAEIGIATGKMHARGPVALEQLCTYKYIIHGNGQTRLG